MKKKVIVFLLLTLLFIPRVFASNMYLIPLYEKTDLNALDPMEENIISDLLQEAVSTGLITESCDNTTCHFSKESKELFSLDIQAMKITINDGVEQSDNLEHMFTEEEKNLLIQINSVLSSYDGVKVLLSPLKCDSVCVKSITFVEKSDTASENSFPSFEGLKGYFDVTFLKQNDYIKYKLVINNPTDTDYEIDDTADVGKYMTYEYSYDTDKKILEKNSDTVVYVTIRYTKEIPNEEFDENGTFVEQEDLIINLGNDAGNTTENTTKNEEENPKTMDLSLIVSIIFAMIMMGSVFLYVFANRKASIGTLAIAILLIPISIYALEKLQININAKVTIHKNSYNITYAYSTFIKESELDKYNLVPNYFEDNNSSCNNKIYIVKNERYIECGIYSESELHYFGENIKIDKIPYTSEPSNTHFVSNENGYITYSSDDNELPTRYHKYFQINELINGEYYHCYGNDCTFTMPNHDVIVKAYTEQSV